MCSRNQVIAPDQDCWLRLGDTEAVKGFADGRGDRGSSYCRPGQTRAIPWGGGHGALGFPQTEMIQESVTLQFKVACYAGSPVRDEMRVGGWVMESTASIEVARIVADFPGVPIEFIDDIGGLMEDGDYTFLAVCSEGNTARILVLTTENFYSCLGKVVAATLPGAMGKKIN